MNNNPSTSPVSFSDDSNATFLIRWRGRHEGPYTAAVIEAKLAANQIGLLHEISHDGQWVTLRDYLSEREAIVRAERQAREEHDRRAREEAERQAKEREERRKEAVLVEETRRIAQAQSAQSQRTPEDHFGQPRPTTTRSFSGFRVLGGILLFVGLAMAKYFFWDFDSSVESGSGRVVNLGLMADRQNGIILGVGLGTVGTIMLVIGFLSSGTRQGQPNVPKPHRAGTILALGIIGLFVFGPLCVAAWVMGNNDLHEMDAGTMDSRARSMTNSGRTLGIIGTILWIIGAIVLFLI